MPKAKLPVNTAHQRIDDHEKLCRIMQNETNRKSFTFQHSQILKYIRKLIF